MYAVYTSILSDCSVCIVANINNKNAGILLNRIQKAFGLLHSRGEGEGSF